VQSRSLLLVAVTASSLALSARLTAGGAASLVAASLVDADAAGPSSSPAPRTAPLAHARADASGILARNPFDHETRLVVTDAAPIDAARRDVLPCPGVKPLVVVGAEDPEYAFAALEIDGKRFLRRRGGEASGMRVAFVGREQIVLERDGRLCVARLFQAPPPESKASTADSRAAPPRTDLEACVAKRIEKTGPFEYAVDRGAVDMILDAQTELMKSRLITEKEGDRVVGVRIVGVRPGSVLATLGIEPNDRLETINGLDVTTPEKMLELYSRLRTAAVDRITVHVTRAGRPLNLDYVVR